MDYQKVKEVIIGRLRAELKPQLTYHNADHTLDVLEAATRLAGLENIKGHDRGLLLTAALFHDTGMLRTYAGHEEASAEIAREMLPAYGYSPADIDSIAGMILSTQIPQSAVTHLEKMLCDADLDYLGRDDFFMIAQQLRYEWNVLNFRQTTLREWYELQIVFLENHRFFTRTAMEMREKTKAGNLRQIKELVCFMQY
jgi:uncharacterized protein